MGFSIDVSILVYASDEGSSFHVRSKELIGELLGVDDTLYLAWEVAYSYIRIATHPSVFEQPLIFDDASANIQELVGNPAVEMIGTNAKSWDIFRRLRDEIAISGNSVPDAVLASILEAHGIKTLYTNDRDFWKFPCLKPVNPF